MKVEGVDFEVGDVPCNGCVRCCLHDAVRILPHEDASQWETEPHPYLPGARMLAHKRDERGVVCVYLGSQGCTIHAYRPQQCRTMDCRLVAQRTPYSKARRYDKRGIFPMAVWQQGKILLRSKE